MAYETKVILHMVAQMIAESTTIEQAYTKVVMAASVEGIQLPSLAELRKKLGFKPQQKD